MFTQFGARATAVRAAAPGFDRINLRILTGVVLAAISLGGCLRTDPPLVGGDPADPHASVAGIGYRSTTAPYTPMRPAVPTGWSGQNNSAPAPTPGR
jgi:hypothetical protein